ncbi:WbqC family protein [Flavicella sediminum]|uniref:WbqC family protein n=1 Tax=Flavicella sediminum TaxID=2585141 RepID=UPI00111D3133|nr:WbqC family protein [Flavicella sediminum]
MTLVHPSYFSPIAQYVAILKADTYEFEVEDNFQKQTYRNRCYIFGPNGKQLLNVPVKHEKGVKLMTKDVAIDYDTADWQLNHMRSFQAAYRSSPFYEFYEDDILKIFQKKHKYLLDLNLDIHEFLMESLQEENSYTKTSTYISTALTHDFRFLVNAKQKEEKRFKNYIQMFDNKFGFLNNLSVLDLLFMEGPSASIYLKKQLV